MPTPTGPTPTDGGPTTSPTSCAIATSVDVTFEEVVKTEYGDTIKIVGSIDALGSWDTKKAISLSASEYTASNPLWKVTIPLKAGQAFEYKYINVKKDGSLVWERDPNRSYTVPKTCATKATKSDNWQG